jgi:hypothetical protein
MTARTAQPAQIPASENIACAAEDHRGRLIGYVLVAAGLLFFLNNLGAFRLVEWRYVWPVALIGLGLVLLARRTRP